eukprot:1196164-Prorocentrum_minimum.AAC.3
MSPRARSSSTRTKCELRAEDEEARLCRRKNACSAQATIVRALAVLVVRGVFGVVLAEARRSSALCKQDCRRRNRYCLYYL